MSRRIFKRRSGIITGDLLQDPVADIATLRLIPARDVDDGQLILVKDVNKIFSFAYGDVTADDGATVISPSYDSSVGRWKKVEFSGGGSGDFADKWIDTTTIPSSQTVTVDGSLEDDRPDEVRRRTIDVQGTLDVVDGEVLLIPSQQPVAFSVVAGGPGPFVSSVDEEIPSAGAINGKGFRLPGSVLKSMSIQGDVTAVGAAPKVHVTPWVDGVSLGTSFTLSIDPAPLGAFGDLISFEFPSVLSVGSTLSARITCEDCTVENISTLFLLLI